MAQKIDMDVKSRALAIIQAPERQVEYRLCARLGIPAVAAIVHDINDAFPELRKDRAFKTWTGKKVAQEQLEYRVVQERGRVPWCDFYTYGAVFGPSAA